MSAPRVAMNLLREGSHASRTQPKGEAQQTIGSNTLSQPIRERCARASLLAFCRKIYIYIYIYIYLIFCCTLFFNTLGSGRHEMLRFTIFLGRVDMKCFVFQYSGGG